MWGPDAQITDYAAKAWHGLYGDYYHERWSMFLKQLVQQKPGGFSRPTFIENMLNFEKAWCANSTQRYSAVPSLHNALEHARPLHAMTLGDVGNYNAVEGVSSTDYGMPFQMWTKDVRQLAKLCDMFPACISFDNTGTVRTGNGTSVKMGGSIMYFKKV
jgi:hypothetical protein